MSPALLVYTSYLLAGACAGLMAGLFGIGGGLVMVPVLLVCFSAAGLPAEVIPPLALGTSLTTIGVTSALASRQHLRLGNLEQPFSARMRGLAAWLAAGVVAGAAVATRLPRDGVLLAVALLQIGVAARMWLATLRRPTPGKAPAQPVASSLRSRWAGPFMCLTGWVSAVGGIGGATLMIPYFSGAGLDHRQASALSTYFGCLIGGCGFVAYGLLSGPVAGVPLSIGLVSLPACASLAAGSALLVGHGARLSGRLSKTTLTRGFCCLLLLSGSKLLLPLGAAALGAQAWH